MSTANARILIVEDEVILALESELRLRSAGYDVVGVVSTAETAVEKATQAKPDLVLMDVDLAGPRDGVSAAEEIYQQLGIRSIIATAHADMQDINRRADRHAGCPAGWLRKPYTTQDLIRMIEMGLGLAGHEPAGAPPDMSRATAD